MDSDTEDNNGYIYCLTNPSLDQVKVGLTTRNDIDKRVKELSKSTSIPTPFEIHSYIKCDNARFYEKIIHRELVEKGIKKDKEFFTCKPEEVEKVFIEFCKKKVYKPEIKFETDSNTLLSFKIEKSLFDVDLDEEGCPIIKTLEEFYKHSRISEIVITNKKKKCILHLSVMYIITKVDYTIPILDTSLLKNIEESITIAFEKIKKKEIA
jgi:hypothetical protein